MSLAEFLGELEYQQIELERIRSLLIVLSEFTDEIPNKDDKDRAVKLEIFCRRQDLLETIVNSLFCKVDTIIKDNEKNLKIWYEQV